MNHQINPGYEAFAKSEHDRMLATAANARLARKAIASTEPKRQPRQSHQRRFSIVKSKFAYALAIATLSIVLAANWVAAANSAGGSGGSFEFLLK